MSLETVSSGSPSIWIDSYFKQPKSYQKSITKNHQNQRKMADIESNRDFNEDRLRLSFSEADLQLVVGADDLKSIERDIHLFQQNSQKFQMIVTSPGPRLTGALRFGAGTFSWDIIQR